MTANEAVLEMRYGGISEEDIEEILEVCKKRGLTPQNIDQELEKKGLDKIFEFEYDASESWYDAGGSGAAASHKAPSKQALEKEKN